MTKKFNLIILILYITFIFLITPFTPSIWLNIIGLQGRNVDIWINLFYVFLFIGLMFYLFFIQPKRIGKLDISLWRFYFLVGCIAGYILMIKYCTLPVERTKFLEYGILAWLLYRCLSRTVNPYFLAFIFALAIGIISEVYQFFIASRVFELRDMVLNATSSLLGLGIVRMLKE